MTLKALNFKMDETEINDMKHVAAVYHMTITDLIKDAVSDYLYRLKADPFYKLTSNVEDADEAETAEILESINNLNDDDLSIVSSKRFTV